MIFNFNSDIGNAAMSSHHHHYVGKCQVDGVTETGEVSRGLLRGRQQLPLDSKELTQGSQKRECQQRT